MSFPSLFRASAAPILPIRPASAALVLSTATAAPAWSAVCSRSNVDEGASPGAQGYGVFVPATPSPSMVLRFMVGHGTSATDKCGCAYIVGYRRANVIAGSNQNPVWIGTPLAIVQFQGGTLAVPTGYDASPRSNLPASLAHADRVAISNGEQFAPTGAVALTSAPSGGVGEVHLYKFGAEVIGIFPVCMLGTSHGGLTAASHVGVEFTEL